MTRFRTILAASLLCLTPALAGCAGALAPPAPVSVTDRTTLDEEAALSVELAYKAFRTAAELATDAGLVKGDLAVKLAVADEKAYQALGAVRAAYRAGSAESYSRAAGEARAAIEAAVSLVKGKTL